MNHCPHIQVKSPILSMAIAPLHHPLIGIRPICMHLRNNRGASGSRYSAFPQRHSAKICLLAFLLPQSANL